MITAFSVSGCFIDIDDDPFNGPCVRGDGPIVTEEFDLDRIDAIDLSLPATVYLRQGDVQVVEVEGQADVLDEINRDVRSGLWKIETNRCVRNLEELRIFITVPNLTEVKISGSGKVISENTFVIDDIELRISGSGDFDMGLDADDINAVISGSGNMKLDGIADNLRFQCSGSGDLQAFNLDARKGTIEITGSGDAEVSVAEALNVRISGSGDVFYRGRPSLNVSITGSGKVIDAN